MFTGAGISAESGIPTFRDANGLWEGYRFEEVASPEGFRKHPELVLEFYNMRRAAIMQAQPNAAHQYLAALAQQFPVSIITQNIDDLHERSGSQNVLHLHGEIMQMKPVGSETLLPTLHPIKLGDVDDKGRQWRPHVVWFGEAVPMYEPALHIAQTADIFIVIGTSLNVYPAAQLVYEVPAHCQIIVIDKSQPYIDPSLNVTYITKSATEGVLDLPLYLSDWI